jgi:tetratricopeptide (TPR) repeat protein
MMGWKDEQNVEQLIAEAGSLISDANEARQAAQLAVNAAESLNPANTRLKFMANFYLMVSHMLQEGYSEAFSLSVRLIAMSDTPELDLGANKHLILLTYTACAVSAVELPTVQAKALKICADGLARYEHTGGKRLLYFRHEYSKLLMANRQYSKAASYAKQLISEKMTSPENDQCDLDCYQAVYAQALGFAFSHQKGIAYLDTIIPKYQESHKLWYARACLHFKAGNFAATLSDSNAAKLICDDTPNHLLNAYAYIMLGRHKEAIDVLSSLCTLDPDNANVALWFSLLTGNMEPMEKFSNKDDWTRPVIQFIQGDIQLEQLITLSKQEEVPSHSLATAFCFAGLQAALQGIFEQARAYYQQCIEHSHPMFADYLWAEANRLP